MIKAFMTGCIVCENDTPYFYVFVTNREVCVQLLK